MEGWVFKSGCGKNQPLDKGQGCHECAYEAIGLKTQMQTRRQNRLRKKDFTKSVFELTGLRSGMRRQANKSTGEGRQAGHKQAAGQNTGRRYLAENQEQENRNRQLEHKCMTWRIGEGKGW